MAPVFLFTGTPGAGKSTTAKALLQRFTRGVHVEVDELRSMVCRGYANPVRDWTPETELQFDLARASAVDIALRYREHGFAVAIDDVAPPTVVETAYRRRIPDIRLVVLMPSTEAALHRSATRTNKNFHPDLLIDCIQELAPMYRGFGPQFVDANVIDSSNMTVEQVLDKILVSDSPSN